MTARELVLREREIVEEGALQNWTGVLDLSEQS